MPRALWDTSFVLDDEYGSMGDWLLATENEIDNVGGLKNVDALGTAVLIALFTDAVIPTNLLLQYGFTKDDQREWHGNLFDIAEGEAPLGSWLWLLRRAPLTSETARLAEHFAQLALQPLIQARQVAGFNVFATIYKNDGSGRGRLRLRISPVGEDERVYFADLFSVR